MLTGYIKTEDKTPQFDDNKITIKNIPKGDTTMKKFTFLLAALIAVSGFTACATQSAQLGPIGLDAAKLAALEAAGINVSDVVVEEVELEERNGQKYYSVDFEVNGRDYEIIVDALTGEIISSNIPSSVHQADVKPEEAKPEQPKADPVPQPATEPNAEAPKAASPAPKAEKPSASVSEAEAKKIALAQVPGAKESDIRGFKVDYDDGRVEYEGKIIYNEMEYEFEIDGHSGAIRDWDAESVYDD